MPEKTSKNRNPNQSREAVEKGGDLGKKTGRVAVGKGGDLGKKTGQ
jgi:hypothetical protein